MDTGFVLFWYVVVCGACFYIVNVLLDCWKRYDYLSIFVLVGMVFVIPAIVEFLDTQINTEAWWVEQMITIVLIAIAWWVFMSARGLIDSRKNAWTASEKRLR